MQNTLDFILGGSEEPEEDLKFESEMMALTF